MIANGAKIVSVRLASESDIEPIAANMRESDVIELRDGIMQTPLEALSNSFRLSDVCLTVTIGNEPVAMCGVGDLANDPLFGVIWYLATKRMDKEGKHDLRVLAPRFVKSASIGYTAVGNLIDCRNPGSIKWLRSLGFQHIKNVVNPKNDLPFALMVFYV